MPHAAWIDTVARTLSGLGYLGLIWFVIAVWLFVREERKDHRFFIPLIIAGGMSWSLVEYILKPFIARPRPPDAIWVWRVVTEPSNYSFPSAHATIAFALAIVFSRYEPRFRWAFFGFAILIGWSRIFLGVHYPSDVFAGALLGVGIGTCALMFRKHPQATKKRGLRSPDRHRKR